MTAYLSVEQVRALHQALVRAFGGADALRDRAALESAVARPAMTFGGEDLYPDLASKAAALMHSLVAGRRKGRGTGRGARHLVPAATDGRVVVASCEPPADTRRRRDAALVLVLRGSQHVGPIERLLDLQLVDLKT